MGNLKEIRKRIVSIQNTQKMTKAMKMVAASKLRKAQTTMFNIRVYAEEMRKMGRFLLSKVDHANQLLIPRYPVQKEALILVTGDRGLCGAFNINVARYAKQYIAEQNERGIEVTLYFVGKKGSEFFHQMPEQYRKTKYITMLESCAFENILEMVQDFESMYVSGEQHRISVIYNKFKTAISQEVVKQQLFPLDEDAFVGAENISDDGGRTVIFEPEVSELLAYVIPRYSATELYDDFMESLASELSARMNSMDAATRNAQELLYKLKLKYNKARQNSITTELMEIVSGAEALK